jgi:hypothetical protein
MPVFFFSLSDAIGCRVTYYVFFLRFNFGRARRRFGARTLEFIAGRYDSSHINYYAIQLCAT